MSVFNRLPEDEEKRRGALIQGEKWHAHMSEENPAHASLYCGTHFNYIGSGGVFPCQDCSD